jgi:hypothetical protein
MVRVNLSLPHRYPPLDEKSPEDLFDFAVELTQCLDNVQVTVPTADQAGELDSAVLDSRIMQKKGVKVF